MSKSKAFKAAGMKIYRGETTPGDITTEDTWTSIGDVVDIDGPQQGAAMIDVTHMDSDDDEEEFIPGRKTRGPITLNVSWAPADVSHDPETGFENDRDNDTLRAYAIQWNNSTKRSYEFTAYVESISITSRQGDKVAATVVLRQTGPKNWKSNASY